MADINSMRIPSVPLISERSLQQAGLSSESPPRNAFAAEVSQVTPKRNEQGEVRYQLTVRAGGQQLTLDSDKPLPEGSQVILAVTDEQPPRVRLVSQQPPNADKALQQLLSQWLASRVPLIPAAQTNQGAKAQLLLNSLQQLSQAPTTPTAVRQVIEQFLQQRPLLPSVEQANTHENAVAVRSALQNSGLFYEQRLLAALQSIAPRSQVPTPASQQQSSTGQSASAHSNHAASSAIPSIAGQTGSPQSLALRLSSIFQQAWQATKASTSQHNMARPSTHSSPSLPSGNTQPLPPQSSVLPKLVIPSPLLTQHQNSTVPGSATPVTPANESLLPSSGGSVLVQLLEPMTPTKLPTPPWLLATVTGHQKTATTVADPGINSASTAQLTTKPSLLQQLAQRLEQQAQTVRQAAAQSTSTNTEEASPSLAQALLTPGLISSQDLKATLSRALQLWLSIIQNGSSERSQNSAPKPAQAQPLPLSYGAGPRPEGLRLLQSTLAQIETEQFQALRSESNSSDSTPFNLPLFMRQGEHIRSIDLEMQTPKQQAAAGRRHGWRVVLHFDLAQAGPLDVEIELNQQQIAATFWSQQSQTLQQLQQQLPPLRSKLTSLGVEVDVLTARHGQLPVGEHNQIRTRLVDLHT
ncbi:hypothetical protein GCM10011297_02770 [Bacterioplanes sanyensis]|uniref:flagellar hook-length control protein FliK n=1 Tax=Bacterioplanes sanyensis TaxID=1249553 RepID=UPI00167AD708|nr:flagellar hook-length control protein FliK [Bacterioplanes sanyensis]GGY33258.1 hypothetical protein GCM10011297_02770 [Bacterioplanes sanyensis]